MELKQLAVVQTGGRVEATFPSLAVGAEVEVIVRTTGNGTNAGSNRRTSRFGWASGLVEFGPDFDKPLPDFDDYR